MKNIVVLFLSFLLISSSSIAASVPFSFTLSGSNLRTSAGVYNSSGVLVRTLWGNKTYPAAGTYNASWDGTDDQGRLLANGNYNIKVLSNNVHYTWQGVVGNTSDQMSGPTVVKAANSIYGMAFAGSSTNSTSYFTTGYNEQVSSLNKLTTPSGSTTLDSGARTILLGDLQGATCDFVTTDGNYVYWSEQDPNNTATVFVQATSVGSTSTGTCYNSNNGTNVSCTSAGADSQVIFSNGPSGSAIAVKPVNGMNFVSGIDIQNNSNAMITGLAVQPNGNYLFVAHGGTNQIDVLNKTTGVLVQSISTFTNPEGLATDGNGNLWVISGGAFNGISLTSPGTTVAQYTVNSNGTLSASPKLVLSGLVEPLAIAVSPDNSTVLVADGGTSQQVKAFSNTNGSSLWTLGQAGGYANSPAVANNKFYFSDWNFTGDMTFIAFAPDGTFWLGDPANARVLHFAANQSYINTIAYVPHFYSSSVDPNNPTRVFANYLEFSVDYTKPLGPNNGSWTLVNNWRYNVTSILPNQLNATLPPNSGYTLQVSEFAPLASVMTLSNNRTYAFINVTGKPQGAQEALVEFPPACSAEITSDCGGGLRYAGYIAPSNSGYYLNQDGSISWVSGNQMGSSQVFISMPLSGFDSSNNPNWGAQTNLASSPVLDQLGPIAGYAFAAPVTSSNVVVAFDNGAPPCSGNTIGCWESYTESGYHLGGILAGSNTWAWRTAISTNLNYQGWFPADGAYDIGNNVANGYAGSLVLSVGRNILWAYHGEFWKNGETNEWNHVYDDGLMVGQFGTTWYQNFGQEAPPMMSGNVIAASLVTGPDGNVYIYHNDESVHGGVHRWLISGLNTISEQTDSVTLTSTTGGLLGQYYDGTTLDNFNLKTSRVDSSVNLSSNPTGTNLSNKSNYSVRWSGFVDPSYSETYTFTVAANSGVRLRIDNMPLVLSIQSGGSNYAVGDILTVEQNGASGMTFQVTGIDSNMAVTGAKYLTQGQGYSIANGLATSGGKGSGCIMNIVSTPLFIDQWNNTSNAQFSASIPLTAGILYPIRLEYYNTATSSVSLSWSSPGQTNGNAQIIPYTNLYPASVPSTSNGTNLMEGLQFNSSSINLYGWNSTATSGLTDPPSWQTVSGTMAYNALAPQDVYATLSQNSFFDSNTFSNTVTRDLGTNVGLTSWILSGLINFQDNQSTQAPGGAYLNVLDGQGNIIASFNYSYPGSWSSTVTDTIYGNSAVIQSGLPDSTFSRTVTSLPQPITISAANGQVTFTYGPYPPVTTTANSGSNWQNPQTLQMAYEDAYPAKAGLAMGLQNMTFLATPSGSLNNKFGDINGDGQVTIADAELAAQSAINLITLTSTQQQAAEVDGNSTVDIYDAYLIAEYAVGLIATFPVQA